MSTDVEEPLADPNPQISTWLHQVALPVAADDEALAAHLVTMTSAITLESSKSPPSSCRT
jgi:hypothetical protein